VATVLKLFEDLAGSKDYFTKLEDALKANISILVPAVMSMDQFAKTIQSLRESNAEQERRSGNTSEDPLGEIRKFLNAEVRTQ